MNSQQIIEWIFIFFYVIIVVFTMIAIMMDNRQPVKTLAWMLAITFLPPVGIVLYFFFGQRSRQKRYINRRSINEETRRTILDSRKTEGTSIPTRFRPLVQLFCNQDASPVYPDNEIDIYTIGKDLYDTMAESISQAQNFVYLTTYIFDDDPLGKRLAQILAEKAKSGVDVKVIYDDVGCWKTSDRFFRQMRNDGIDVRPFMPVRFPAFTRRINHRNHRKFCIVDGKTGFIGGMNIAQRYVDGKGGTPWRDMHLKVQGDVVRGLMNVFYEDWFFVSKELLTPPFTPSHGSTENNPSTPPPPSTPSTSSGQESSGQEGSVQAGSGQAEATEGTEKAFAQIVTSSPTDPWHNIMQGYVKVLLEAQEYVYMESPYFLPTEPVLLAMRTAALSGVDVRLMLSHHSDSTIVDWASRSFLGDMVDAGVKVYLYEQGFNHSKLLVCDDAICTCGSTNLDFRSFENNFESNIFIYDASVAQRMKKQFLTDQDCCLLFNGNQQLNKRPFFKRLAESFFRLFSPLM